MYVSSPLSFLCAFLCFLICLCEERTYVIRRTKYGQVKGFIEKIYGGRKIEKYFGIPYAQPPVGSLRFEPPAPPLPWGDTVLPATELPPSCPQHIEGLNYIMFHVPRFNRTSEDCLYLNIYTPRKEDNTEKLPVMVFVHGGSYQTGSGAILDGSMLAGLDTIVVTFNYRIGALGFLTAADSDLPGNYGMLDQVAALKWVKDNIAQFNGDPNQVTIDGHSAGGCSVGLHLLSPLSKGLFKRVIQQSGSPLAHWAVTRYREGPDFLFKVFAASLGCMAETTKETKACLQKLSSDRVEQFLFEESVGSPTLSPLYRPIVDGHFLPDTPKNMVAKGILNADQFLTGVTKDEGHLAVHTIVETFCTNKRKTSQLLSLSLMTCLRGELPFINGIVDHVLEQYTQWPVTSSETQVTNKFAEIVGDYFITAPTHLYAQMLSRRNMTVYMYNFEYGSKYDQGGSFVPHGSEIFYLTGFPFTNHPDFRYDHDDKQMSSMIQLMWANFIRNGLPSLIPHEEFHVLPYTAYNPVYVRLFSTSSQRPAVSMANHLKQKKMSFWNEKIPAMYQKQYGQPKCNRSRVETIIIPDTSSTWVLLAVCLSLSVLTMCLSVCYCRTRRQVRRLIRMNSISSGQSML